MNQPDHFDSEYNNEPEKIIQLSDYQEILEDKDPLEIPQIPYISFFKSPLQPGVINYILHLPNREKYSDAIADDHKIFDMRIKGMSVTEIVDILGFSLEN